MRLGQESGKKRGSHAMHFGLESGKKPPKFAIKSPKQHLQRWVRAEKFLLMYRFWAQEKSAREAEEELGKGILIGPPLLYVVLRQNQQMMQRALMR